MKKVIHLLAAATAVTLLSGCAGAAFNRIEITANRHITIGQELMDLKTAHEKGIISDTEYMETKKQVLNFAAQIGGVNIDGAE